MTKQEFMAVFSGFYDPNQRARQKANQRRQEQREIAAGRGQEVEARNHWLRVPCSRQRVDWESPPPLE